MFLYNQNPKKEVYQIRSANFLASSNVETRVNFSDSESTIRLSSDSPMQDSDLSTRDREVTAKMKSKEYVWITYLIWVDVTVL